MVFVSVFSSEIVPLHTYFLPHVRSAQNKKADPAKGFSFGSSAIFLKTRRFPTPSHERIGFVGNKFSNLIIIKLLNLFPVKIYF